MRIRSIKPGFFMDEELAKLDGLTRLFFIGLWCAADSQGRLEDRPLRLKASIMPYDAFDCETALLALANSGFIQRYEADGKRVVQIRTFREHQRITGKEAEAESKFPPPPEIQKESLGKHSGNNGETHEKQPESLEGKGREGKGISTADAVFIPDVLAALAGFTSSWAEFKVHRRKSRAAMTPRAEELILKTLEERPAEAIAAIHLSIRKGWKDINWRWFDNQKGKAHGKNSSTGGQSSVGSAHDPQGSIAAQY